jgi:2,3-bisphosphoglycerate-dependent phosphoglycerate mutase
MRWAWNNRPPPISETERRQADYAMKYPQAGAALPRGESLIDVIERVRPWWGEVQSQVAAGQRTIVCTHGTTLRALRVLIEELTPDEIFTVRTENGAPVCFDIDQAGRSARID